jgi:hypothetical protein
MRKDSGSDRMKLGIPRLLTDANNKLVLIGHGTSPGSVLFRDLRNKETIEMFGARIVRFLERFSVAEIHDGTKIKQIRIYHSNLKGFSEPPRPGSTVVAGPVYETVNHQLTAKMAWKVKNESDGHDGSQRRRGVIIHVAAAGTFGKILDYETGKPFFVHQNELPRGMSLKVKTLVTFLAGFNEKGGIALDVKPVAA